MSLLKSGKLESRIFFADMATLLLKLGLTFKSGISSSVSRQLITSVWIRSLSFNHYSAVSRSEKPKRPLSAYLEWLQGKRQEIKTESPDASVTEVSKIAGRMWREVDAIEKKHLNAEAKARMEEYKTQSEAFYKSLTPEEKSQVLKDAVVARRRRAHNREVRLKHRLGKPVRVRNAYTYFVMAQMKQRGSISAPEYMKECAILWKSLSNEERKPYEALAAKDKARYEKEIEIWEDEMKEKGYTQLLRSSKKGNKTQKTSVKSNEL